MFLNFLGQRGCVHNSILFTEGGQYPQGTPTYIAQSIWTLHNYDKFNAYTRALQRDLNDSTVAKGYVS